MSAKPAAPPPAASAPPPLRIAVVGGNIEGLESLPANTNVVLTHLQGFTHVAADVFLFPCPALQRGEERTAALETVAAQLRALAEGGGRHCRVAGLPVFVVLTQVDRLARPGDSHAGWLEQIEEQKQAVHEDLQKQVPKAGTGFGGIDVHVWATAARRPNSAATGTPEAAFGIQELVQQAAAAGRRYLAHQALQQKRTRAALTLLVVTLAIMLGIAALWGWQRGGFFGGERKARLLTQPAPDESPASLRTLGERAAAYFDWLSLAELDWARWVVEVERLDAEITAALLAAAGDAAQAEKSAELRELQLQLVDIRDRVVLLGVAGEEFRPETAALRGPRSGASIEQCEEAAQRALAALRARRPQFNPAALSGRIPLSVARELDQAATASLERFLDPVREEIKQRVLKAGDGKETLAGWRRLRDEWLTTAAPRELPHWRETVRLLQRLRGNPHAGDPLQELSAFLRREQVELPLDRVELRWPRALKVNGTAVSDLHAAGEPLELRVKKPTGEEQALNLKPRPDDVPAGHVFGLQDRRLTLEPGSEVMARLPLKDAAGQTWWLVWTPVDRASQVFGSEVLFRAPRILTASQTDPTQGPIVFGAEMEFGEPIRWPVLMPR